MIRNLTVIATMVVASFCALTSAADDGVHLVMLTGDERMQNLDESVCLLPLLRSELGEDKVIIVKAAYQRKHLGHWSTSWAGNFRGREIRDYAQGWILDELIQKARAATDQKKVQSVTLIWAQGTSDTSEGYAESYDRSFRELTDHLAKAMGRDDIGCVIARLGLVDESSKRHPNWNTVRAAQEQLGDSLPHTCWVDTDAVIDKSKDYSDSLGKLLAAATLKQIRENPGSTAAVLPARKIPEEKQPAHLFLLSGQSNMANLDPEEAFVPAVVEAFGEPGAIVVKAAYGAKSISHWYQWSGNPKHTSTDGNPDRRNWLYRELMGKTKFAIADREIKSVTFCWMQGENDASNETSANAYAENFESLLQLLREDLGRDDINFVIGRLSDHSNPAKFPAWEQMRGIQVKLAESSPRGRWIDTDAWNGDDDNLHYPSGENGRVALGKSFATQAIELACSSQP